MTRCARSLLVNLATDNQQGNSQMCESFVLSSVLRASRYDPQHHRCVVSRKPPCHHHRYSAYFQSLPSRQAEQSPTKQRLRIAHTDHETPSNVHVTNTAAAFVAQPQNAFNRILIIATTATDILHPPAMALPIRPLGSQGAQSSAQGLGCMGAVTHSWFEGTSCVNVSDHAALYSLAVLQFDINMSTHETAHASEDHLVERTNTYAACA